MADALEEFLGTPLLASRIETNYDVVAQILSEMCDAGLVSSTEANALRDVVDTPSFLNNLAGKLGLPGSSPALTGPPSLGASGLKNTAPTLSTAGSQIPWRRSNVRHTSNELYVDIVETLHVTFAPSGRPLTAFARGSIAFTAKVSGVPDLLLTLATASSSGSNVVDRGEKVRRLIALPVFHPCVRLARWKDRGELSFVPPDGRFVLAGYEVDLLDEGAVMSAKSKDLNLPVSVEVRKDLGPSGNEFEVRLGVNHRFSASGSTGSNTASQSLSSNLGRGGLSRGASSDVKVPAIDNLMVQIPIPAGVRNLSDLRPSKGEAHWSPGDTSVEWRINAKEASTIGPGGAVLRCTVVGNASGEDEGVGLGFGNGMKSDTYDYDEDTGINDQDQGEGSSNSGNKSGKDSQRAAQNATLMPTSANLSFSVKGWLASGLKVDSLTVDVKKSKGLGEGVKPYKGVKYLTASRSGVETRC